MPAMLLAASLTLPRPDTFGMQPARPSGHSVWAVGANLTCSQCQRVVSNIEGYCKKQRPMGDLDLSCFDCTWAHQEMPGCQRIMALIKARPQPIPEPSGDCCLTKCSCIPNCGGCACDSGDCMPPPPPPPPLTNASSCECLEPDGARNALHALRKFCSSFQPADQALWAADATERPFGGHYRLPATFDKFCALHTAFSVEGEASEQCDEFLQRLAASSRPAPAKLCELACGDWCDPCCGEHAAESPLRCR